MSASYVFLHLTADETRMGLCFCFGSCCSGISGIVSEGNDDEPTSQGLDVDASPTVVATAKVGATAETKATVTLSAIIGGFIFCSTLFIGLTFGWIIYSYDGYIPRAICRLGITVTRRTLQFDKPAGLQ